MHSRMASFVLFLAVVSTASTRADELNDRYGKASTHESTKVATNHAEEHRDAPSSIRVKVDVSVGDEDTRALIESLTKRELRTLGDVEVVDERAHYEVEIVGVEANISGKRVGFAISTVVHCPVDTETFGKILDVVIRPDANKDASKQLLLGYAKGRTSIEMHKLRIVPFDDLTESCRTVVADFDTKCLESYRKAQRRLSENAEREKHAPLKSN